MIWWFITVTVLLFVLGAVNDELKERRERRRLEERRRFLELYEAGWARRQHETSVTSITPKKIIRVIRPTMTRESAAQQWRCPCGSTETDQARALGIQHNCPLERVEEIEE